MADDLGVRFFTDAKAQYESAGKWRWVVIALLGYAHVGLVLPFAAGTGQMAEIQARIEANRATKAALDPVAAEAGQLVRQVNQAQNKVAADLRDVLVERFRRLSTVVEALAKLGADRAEAEDGEAVFADAPARMSMQQVRQTSDPSALAPMPATLRRFVAERANQFGPGEVPNDLQTYIEGQLIPPAFERANAAWRQSGLAVAQDGTAALAKRIADARDKANLPAAVLEQLAASVEALRGEAARLEFKPPPDHGWWRSVDEKGASIKTMTAGFVTQVGKFNASQGALQAAAGQIADVVQQSQAAAVQLEKNLDDLNERAKALQSQLGEWGGPLKVVSFKLSEIAPFLPLIIAAALAAIAAWTADGLRRMSLAAGLVTDAAEAAAVRTWLRAAAGGSRIRVATLELAVATAAVAWVLIAAFNVASLTPPLVTQRVLGAIAVAIVLAGRAYHWRCADLACAS